MREVGNILEHKGHDFKIKEQEYSMDKKAFAIEAGIEFKIFPKSNAEEFF